MAGLIRTFSRLGQNIRRAKARFLVIGTLVIMVLIVILGTIFVLRFSYSPVVKQYQAGIERTLQRVVSDFDSLDGRTAFINITRPAPKEGSLPLTRLPLDYINYLPGHIEEFKSLDACSYSYKNQPNSEACAGILESRKQGAMIYIQGSFDLHEDLSPPIYSKSPKSGHHFLLSIESRKVTQNLIVTFDRVLRPKNSSKSVYTDAWSMTGFRFLGNEQKAYVREPEIKGRVLVSNTIKNHYRFILQAPIQAYMEDALTDSKVWPPKDTADTKITLKVLKPDSINKGQIITDTADLVTTSHFSFSGMSVYLASGETLTFTPSSSALGTPVEVKSSHVEANSPHRSNLKTAFKGLSDIFIRAVIPNITTQKSYSFGDGSSIRFNGNASLVFIGWRSAAQFSIAFALVLCTCLILAGAVLNQYLLAPLNNLRRNTLYLRDKFSDADSFKLPYTIKNKSDEVGVLWSSILDLHRSITSYGREALESTKRQADFLRALGHEIKSPLQDLTIRHSDTQDPSFKSIKRITHALKILSTSPVGTSEINPSAVSPKEAISAFKGKLTRENVSEYLNNAEEVYSNVKHKDRDKILTVSADAELLEASLTAILNNANDFRKPETEITITSYSDAEWVLISITNIGPHINHNPIEEIFEFGVSSRSGDSEHQGMGLYVAKQHIINMGGDIIAKNIESGVQFNIKLVRLK